MIFLKEIMQQSYFDKNSYKKSFENTKLNQTWLKWTFADPFAKLLPTACFSVKDGRHDFKKLEAQVSLYRSPDINKSS